MGIAIRSQSSRKIQSTFTNGSIGSKGNWTNYWKKETNMEFIKENWEGIVAILTSTIAIASAVAAMTPTPKDDGIVKKVYKIVDLLALNFGKAKDK